MVELFEFLLKEPIVVNQSEYAIIENQNYIHELLKELHENKKGITIVLGSVKKNFKTFIESLGIKDKSRFFETDYIPFINLYKNRFYTERVVVVFRYDDIFYGFIPTFVTFSPKNSGVFFQIPTTLYKLQRRKFVRVSQSLSMPITVQIAPYIKEEQKEFYKNFLEFWKKEKNTIEPTVIDISEGGIGIMISSTTSELNNFLPPMFLLRITLQDMIIEAIAHLATIQLHQKKGNINNYRVGFSFRNIDKNSQNEIKKYVMIRQTEILRNRKDK
ncbi:PilZ domain-containing protein [bacterium]|nr:PilZ domain-containing protein [bacterium]